jgi:hypothetical protein
LRATHSQRDINFGSDQILDAIVERDIERDARMRAREFEQLRSNEHSAEARRHTDAHAAAQGLPETVDRRARCAQVVQHALAALIERVSGLR